MPPLSRRAFAPSPVLVLLAALLIGIVAWKVSYQRDLVPSSHPRAAALKTKFLTDGISTVIGCIAIAGGIGAACYFAFKRSERASNIAMSTWMTVPVLLLSCRAFLTMTSSRPPPDSIQAATPENPSDQQPAPQPRSSTPASKAPDPSITLALGKLEAEINTQTADALAKLDPVLTLISKSPKMDKTDLRKRAEDAASARESIDTLARRFRAVTDDATTALEESKVESARTHAIRFAGAINAGPRASSCDAIARLLDQAKQEADFLLANYGQWKIGRDGTIESTNSAIQSRAHSARFFIDAWLKTKDQELAIVRGE
jgi:hypothetical protein